MLQFMRKVKLNFLKKSLLKKLLRAAFVYRHYGHHEIYFPKTRYKINVISKNISGIILHFN